jgi:hypothetical protein
MKFGVREICDVTFKTTADNQKIGSTVFAKAGTPAFMIDTAKTSSMEQATTTVYAQGGKGNTRLIAWEGEKTMTFTVEDALISPMGLAVLSGAGLIAPSQASPMHVHVTITKTLDANGVAEIKLDELKEETGLNAATKFTVCTSAAVPAYATKLDGSGAGIAYFSNVAWGSITGTTTLTWTALTEGTDKYDIDEDTTTPSRLGVKITDAGAASSTVMLDFYLIMTQAVQEITIAPSDFGGFFYVEAQTLFRREDSGQDMAAELIFPRVKVQSGFTFSMASSGDPSTFTFTMDAFPGYTQFDKTKKVMCVIQVIGTDDAAGSAEVAHTHTMTEDTPSF